VNLFAWVLPTPACNWFRLNYTTSSSSLFTPTPSGDTSTPTIHSTIFVYTTIGHGCTHPTKSKSFELVYNFPIEAPFLVLFVDAHSAEKHSSFDVFDMYLVACCGMTGFASMEPVIHANSKNFESAIMQIQLRYGFCHTIVLDKDSKFYSISREALDLLHINCHVLYDNNHNPMMVKWVNRYFTKGLKIMTIKCDSVRVAHEAILVLLLYAWDLCPIPGTNLSCSLVAVGHKFAFPIDYSINKH
jgi:hypothetical protein